MKIRLNPVKYLECFVFAVHLAKPCESILILLAIITSAYTMTKWHDICLNSAWALLRANGYPMICCNSMPKPYGSVAYSTSVVEIRKAFKPIVRSKIVGQIVLGIMIAKKQRLTFCSPQWCFSGFVRGVLNSVGVGYSVIALPLLAFLSISLVAIAVRLLIPSAIIVAPLFLICAALLSIVIAPRLHLFSMVCAITWYTAWFQSALCFRFKLKVFSSGGERLTAVFADFKRGFHSVSLSLYLIWELANGEIFRCFRSYPSQLSNCNII